MPKKVPLSFNSRSLEVTHQKWKRFVYWAKSTGFDLVFALNNEEKTVTGIWDPNTALRILTVAEKAKVGNIFWELGYGKTYIITLRCVKIPTMIKLNIFKHFESFKVILVVVINIPPHTT